MKKKIGHKFLASLTIPGKPVAKKRPYVGKRGAFDIQATEKAEFKHYICEEWRNLGQTKPLDIPLVVECDFYLPFPKSFSLKKRESHPFHTKKPDLDNLFKFLDCCNGIIWKDDALIYELALRKFYEEYPRTEIFIFAPESEIIGLE